MFKYTKDELLELKTWTDSIAKFEGGTKIELTDELLQQLKARVYRWPNTDVNAIFLEPFVSACGCIGPMDGDLYCPCQMTRLRYEYRYDIALSMLDDMENKKGADNE